jgi:PEP-CTERM motif
MRGKIQFAVAGLLFFSVAGGMSAPVRSGLVGDGTNTVSAFFWLPSPTSAPPTCTTSLDCETEDYEGPSGPTDTPPPTIPVDFLEGNLSGSTISVGDTQIVITNMLTGAPFCSTSVPCPDVFTGFQFLFSSGVDITNVTVDKTSAADFLPVAGGLTFTPTAIYVNVAGDEPGAGDKLILNVTTFTPTPVVPEPSTWALMLLGFAGLGIAGYRRKFGRAQTARAG